MEDILRKRKRYKNGAPLLFIIGCLINYNFKSFRNFLIYIYHFSGYLDLRKKSSDKYTDEQIINTLELLVGEKIRKKDLYVITNQSKNTFNKNFKEYFINNDLTNRRTFSLFETYQILNYWQGDGKWGRLNAIKKQTISEIINSGNYKQTAEEFYIFKDEKFYKSKDKFSPKEIKNFIKHIELNEEDVEEELMGYEDFKTMSLWIFGAVIVSTIWQRSTTHNNVYSS